MVIGLLLFGNHAMDIDGNEWGLSLTIEWITGYGLLKPPCFSLEHIYTLYTNLEAFLGVQFTPAESWMGLLAGNHG